MNRNQTVLLSITAFAAFAIGLAGCSIEKAVSPTTPCVGDACAVNPAAPATSSAVHTDIPLNWPGTLANAYASEATQIVAVVWNPGCSWCQRAMPVLNDPACFGVLVNSYALANVKAQTADGQKLLARGKIMEFPAVIILRKTAGAWDVHGAGVYRPAKPTFVDFLVFVDSLATLK